MFAIQIDEHSASNHFRIFEIPLKYSICFLIWEMKTERDLMEFRRENENLGQIVAVIHFYNRIKYRPLDRFHADY